LSFSPDSGRLGYFAQAGAWWMAVVDGDQGEKYDGIVETSLVFSPGSKRVTYVARQNNKWMVVADEKPGPPYDRILGAPVFSPDGRSIAYGAGVENRQFAVLNDKPGNTYDYILASFDNQVPEFVRFDAPGTIHYLAEKGCQVFLVEESLSPSR
jgi:hypothetical protein